MDLGQDPPRRRYIPPRPQATQRRRLALTYRRLTRCSLVAAECHNATRRRTGNFQLPDTAFLARTSAHSCFDDEELSDFSCATEMTGCQPAIFCGRIRIRSFAPLECALCRRCSG
jgi:hypothetical protein